MSHYITQPNLEGNCGALPPKAGRRPPVWADLPLADTPNHRSCGVRACPEDSGRRVPRNNGVYLAGQRAD